MTEAQGTTGRGTVLDRILETKRTEVRGLAARRRELEEAAEAAPPPRGFARALAVPGEVSLIAEVKRRSPGAGPIRPDLDPVEVAAAYARGGAAAVSVLTDRTYFGGGLGDLEAIAGAVAAPLLRKDFVLDPVQLVEARASGADAVLLIVRVLDDASLRNLLRDARALGMDALVEAHDAGEVGRALDAGADVVGINNRDLATFTTRLEVTEELAGRLPPDVLLVSESGIGGAEDVRRLGRAGVDAILVGESLLRRPDPGSAAAELAGHARVPRPGAS